MDCHCGLDLRLRGLAFALVAADHDNGGAQLCQSQGGGFADAGIAARHQADFSLHRR